MADVVTRLKVESSEYDSKIQRAAKGIQHLEDATRRAGKTMADASKEDIAFVKSLGKMETVSNSAKGKVSELSQAFVNLTVQYNNLTKAEKSSQFGKAMSQSLDQLKGRIKGLNADIAGAQKQLGGLGGGGGLDLGGMMKGLGPAAIAAGAAGLAMTGLKKAMTDMVQVNMQFEQSAANLSAVMGLTAEQAKPLTDQAKQLGATTRYTASEILELQTNLGKLGFDTGEILNSTSAVQALATATGADLGSAAELAGSALRGFGMNATEMERVASTLAVSTTKSALSFDKLAAALPTVAPVAKQMGFSIEDTVTLLGKLSDAGMDASTAATSTRNIFLKMADGSSDLAKALGHPVKSLDELAPALQELKKKGIDLADMLELTDKRSVAAFATFVDGSDKLLDLRNSITDCSDALHEMEDKQINTLQGSVTMLNSAWEGLLLTFSGSNGILKQCTDALTELLTAWTKWENRKKGGDEAVKTYQMSDSKVAEYGKQYIEADRQAGRSDKAIKKSAEEENQALKQQEATLQGLIKVYEEFEQKRKDRSLSNKEYAQAKKDASEQLNKYGYSLAQGQYEKMQKDLAQKRDSIAINDYIVSSLTEAPTPEITAPKAAKVGGGGSSKKKSKTEKEELSELEKRDKRIKEITKSIEEMNGVLASNADENTKAWATDKLETFQKELDKLNGKKQVQQIEGPSGYSQEGISALRKQLQDDMKGMQMGSDEYMFEAERLVDLTTFENILKTAVENGIHLDQSTLETMFEGIDNAEFGVTPSITDDAWKALVDQINEKLKEQDLPAIELDVKTGGVKELDKEVKKTTDNVAGAAAAFSALGDAMSQIDDPGAKVAGMIAEAIASVASGYGAATAQAATLGPWAWIAFAVTGLATMISTIAGIKQATAGSYASGGIIPGNSFSGDNLTANVNSGELILNRSQQNTLAGQLQGNPMSNLKLATEVSGRNLRVVLNNDNRSEGGSRGYYSDIH